MFAWYFRLPLLVRVPLLSAAMIFLIAMAVMQIAVLSLSAQYERQTERVGQVYLDGLSAAVAPAYRDRDIPAITAALERSLDFYVGVIDRQLAIVDQNDGVLAHIAGPNLDHPTAPPDEIYQTAKGHLYEASSMSLWVWRGLEPAGIVAANLDVSAFAQERASLRLKLVLAGIAVSMLSALGGYLLLRRLQRPLDILHDRLGQASAFGPDRIPEPEISSQDGKAKSLMQAYNGMVDAVQERELLAQRLASQDRQAMLGRIAATLAHEIRNPLAGIMTALQTVRAYGDDARSRAEALDFVDRGIQSLQDVAQATLNLYRPHASGAALTLTDLRDVARLVEPHARQRGVALETELALPDMVAVDAFKLRQIILNLLLNAVQTTPRGGTVRYCASLSGPRLSIEVRDQGTGLPAHVRDQLLSPHHAAEQASLGISTIRRLTDELGARIEAGDPASDGSLIRIVIDLSAGRPGEAS